MLNSKIEEIDLILVHRLRCTWKQNFSDFSFVMGRWKSDKHARHVRGRCIDNLKSEQSGIWNWKISEKSTKSLILLTHLL